MITKTVEVTISVEVTVDETKFTPEFLKEFREDFYEFDDIDDHIEHLAQLTARGIMEENDSGQFVEGYGTVEEFGITTNIENVDVDILD